jgi:two-component system, chemotaxis family, sensor kinase CheA
LESDAYRRDKLVYSAGMQRAFAILERLTAERAAAVEGRALLLQIAGVGSLLAAVLAWMLEQRDRRRQAALHAANLERLVAQRTEELSRRNGAMRVVLDTIQQGLVSLDKNGWIASERSAMVDRWFGAPPERVKFSDHMRSHDAIFADTFELGMEQLRDNLLMLEMGVDQMPKRLRAQNRTIGIEYDVILAHEEFNGLLVVMSDITSELEAARVEQEQRDLLRVFECIGRDRSGFVHFLEEADQIVAELRGEGLPITRVLRLVHTLKGNAAQFGASGVAAVCHEIEGHLTEQGEMSDANRDWIDSTWRGFMDRVRLMVTNRSETHLEVEKGEFQSVVQLVRRRQNHDDILRALSSWELDPVQPRLERLAEYARVLADRLGKGGLEVVCDAQALRVDSAGWGSFWAACVHLVRNAVDHGIEARATRLDCGKSAGGHLLLSAEVDNAEFVVQISDDGGGIEWAALGAQAAKRGLPVSTDSERMEALFADGVSTSGEATDVSGRGVGMAAVRDEVRRRGGLITIDSHPHRGTTCVMRFAAEAMLRAEPSRRSHYPIAKAVSS